MLFQSFIFDEVNIKCNHLQKIWNSSYGCKENWKKFVIEIEGGQI